MSVRPPADAPPGEWATYYAAAFGWKIFPCGERSKSPLTPNGVKDATGEHATIWEWWHRWPKANVAVATGIASGLWVLDLDRKQLTHKETGEVTTIDGFATLAQIEQGQEPVPRTIEQNTGGGGQQIFFRMPALDIRNSVAKLGPGLDVRGTLGYVLIPPSIHPNGTPYAWTRHPAENLLVFAPPWLIERLVTIKKTKPASERSATIAPPVSARQLTTRQAAYLTEVISSELARIRAAPEGTRNHTLNQAVFAMAQFIPGGWITSREVEGAAFEAAFDAGLDDVETRKTVGSAITAAAQNPRDPPTSQQSAAALQKPKNGHDDTPPLVQPEPKVLRETAEAVPPPAEGDRWQDALLLGDKGPRAIVANAIIALRDAPEWSNVIGRDLFRQRTVVRKPAPWMLPDGHKDVAWSDHDDTRAAEWLQHHDIRVTPLVAAQAVEIVAADHGFHSVNEYLNRCVWDGKHRLDHWAVRYLGAPDTAYIQAAGARWMISAVARVEQPGCKADCAIILEGKQGIKKSTALKTLGGEWYADELADLGSKDAALQLAGVWIVELAELDAVTRGEVTRIKAFMSRCVDHFRAPYGHRVQDVPRQCVFAGSVNGNEYLRDETGGRRFWPVPCSVIDIDGLAEVRDQLWGEARDRLATGDEVWWFNTDTLIADATEQQQLRYQADAWDTIVQDFIANRDHVSIGDVLGDGMGKSRDQWTQPDQNRIARSLRLLGWERYQTRVGEKREWRYRRRSIVD